MMRLLRRPFPFARLGQASIRPRRPMSYFSNPKKTSANIITWGFVGANSVVYMGWTYAQTAIGPDQLLFGLTRRDVADLLSKHFTYDCSGDRWWKYLTSSVSHNTASAFLTNMLFYHGFAGIVSVFPGVGAAHVLGLMAGSAALGGYWAGIESEVESMEGISASSRATGAAAVISGVGTAAACAVPTLRMVLMWVVPVPLCFAVPVYIGTQELVERLHEEFRSTSAIGGCLFGAAYYFLFLRRLGRLR